MRYSDFAKRAAEQGRGEELTPKLFQWDEEGKELVGKFISRHAVPSGLGGGDFYLYLFDTDEGRVQFALGAGVDQSVGADLKPDGLYSIQYGGKQRTSKGFQVNQFTVIYYGQVFEGRGSDGPDTPSTDKVPF